MRCLVERVQGGIRSSALALVVAAACLGSASPMAWARDFASRPASAWEQSDRATISIAQLPPAAARVLAAIREGGPFKYPKDGVVFGNRERLLPRQPRGYYREYTVPTPWARDRGARRIVCGGAPRTTDECYYTDDHYSSFKRIQG
jgi:ribonuclease T1